MPQSEHRSDEVRQTLRRKGRPQRPPRGLVVSTELPCTINIRKLGKGSQYTLRLLPSHTSVTIPWKRLLDGARKPPLDSIFLATISAEDGRQWAQRFPYMRGLNRLRIKKGTTHPYIDLSGRSGFSAGAVSYNRHVKSLPKPKASDLLTLDRHAAYLDLLALGDEGKASEFHEKTFHETMESLKKQELESFPFRGELLVKNELGEDVTLTTLGQDSMSNLTFPLGEGRILRTGWAAIAAGPDAKILIDCPSDSSRWAVQFTKSTWLSTLTIKKDDSGKVHVEGGTDFMVPQGFGVRAPSSMNLDLPPVTCEKTFVTTPAAPGKWRQVMLSNLSDQDVHVALSSEVSGENLISTTVYPNEDLHHIWDFLKGEVDLPPRLGDPMEVRVRCGKHSAKYAFNYNPLIRKIKLFCSETGVAVRLKYDEPLTSSVQQLHTDVNFRRVGLSASDEKTLLELANTNKDIRRNRRRPAIRLSPILQTGLPQLIPQWLPAGLYEDVSPPSNKPWLLCIRNTGPACAVMLPGNNDIVKQVGDLETICTSWQEIVPSLKEKTCDMHKLCVESSEDGGLSTYLLRATPFVRVLTIKHTSDGPKFSLEDNWKDESGVWATEDAEQNAKLGEKEADLTPIANDPSAIAALTSKKTPRYASAIVEAAKRRGMRIELDDVLSTPNYPGPGIHPQPSKVRGSDRVYQPERQESLDRLIIRFPENNTFSFVVSVEKTTVYPLEGGVRYESEDSRRLLDAPPFPGVTFLSLNRKNLVDDLGFGVHLRVSAKDENDYVTTTSFPVTPHLHRIDLEKDDKGKPRVHPRYFRWVDDARRVVVPAGGEEAFPGWRVMRKWETPSAQDAKFLRSPEHLNKRLEDVEELWFDLDSVQSTRFNTDETLWERPNCKLTARSRNPQSRRRRSALLGEESLPTNTSDWREGGEGLHKMATAGFEDGSDVRQPVRRPSKAKNTSRQSSGSYNENLLTLLSRFISLVPFGGALEGGGGPAVAHG